MSLEWTADLSIDNEHIDAQHREIFRRVNLFVEALQSNREKDQLEAMLRFLQGHIENHFEAEEKLMRSLNYIGYSDHLLQHATFRVMIQDIRKKYEEKGQSWDLLILTQGRLVDWLKKHIAVVDRKLAVFLKENGIKG